MAAGERAEIIMAPYTVWIAPVGTSFPTLAEEEGSFPSAWTKLGSSGNKNYSDAGVTVAHSQTVNQFTPAGSTRVQKSVRVDEGLKVSFDLADLSATQYALIMDNATVTHVTGANEEFSFELARGFKVKLWAVLARGVSALNEGKNAQYEVSSAFQAGNPAPKFAPKSGATLLAVEFDAVEAEAGKYAVLRQGK